LEAGIDLSLRRSYSGRMRWDALFDDLESQLDESDRLGFESEISDRTRAELAVLGLTERLRGALGLEVGVLLACGESFQGILVHAGAEALVLHQAQHQILVPYAAVTRYSGLGRLSRQEPSCVRRSLGLAHSLRALAAGRSEVTLMLVNGGGTLRLEGVIDRVGQDYLDLAAVRPGEARRPGQVMHVATVPFSSLAAVTSRPSDGL
jgi:hypothetical protein